MENYIILLEDTEQALNGWKNRTNRLRSRNSNTALLLRDKAVSKQTDNSPKIWVRTDGDYITENQFNEMLRSGKTQHEIEKELERNGFTRAKGVLSAHNAIEDSLLRFPLCRVPFCAITA